MYAFGQSFSLAIPHTESLIDTDFVALGSANNSWNVVRSEFDNLLLQHAAESGAKVFTQTKVESLEFHTSEHSSPIPISSTGASAYVELEESRPTVQSADTRERQSGTEHMGRPFKASYTRSHGQRGEIKFDYLVDASGRNGILSTRFFKRLPPP
jgi:flavine halogenase